MDFQISIKIPPKRLHQRPSLHMVLVPVNVHRWRRHRTPSIGAHQLLLLLLLLPSLMTFNSSVDDSHSSPGISSLSLFFSKLQFWNFPPSVPPINILLGKNANLNWWEREINEQKQCCPLGRKFNWQCRKRRWLNEAKLQLIDGEWCIDSSAIDLFPLFTADNRLPVETWLPLVLLTPNEEHRFIDSPLTHVP